MNTPYTIYVKRFEGEGRNAHNKPIETWGDPTPVEVFAIAPRGSTEPLDSNRAAVETDLAVLAPVDTQIGRKDVVIVNGEEYTVQGNPIDWGQGPFDYEPGLEIILERVSG